MNTRLRIKAVLGIIAFFLVALLFGLCAAREDAKERRACVKDRNGKVVPINNVNAPGGWICQGP